MNARQFDSLNTADLLLRLEAAQYAVERGEVRRAWDGLLRTARSLYEQAARHSTPQAHADLMLGDRFRELARQLSQHGGLARQGVEPAEPAPAAAGVFARSSASPVEADPPPALTLDDVVGQEPVKAILRARYLYPDMAPELAARYGQTGGGGVLLYGLPGNGKTHMVRCLAGALGAQTFVIQPANILSKFLGDAEARLAQVFAAARRSPKALVFVDEIDALAVDRDRQNDSSAMVRLLSQLLVELDGFSSKQQSVRLIAASNRPWSVDPALLRAGRFDALAMVELPDSAARRMLLTRALANLPCAPDLDLDTLVGALHGYSAREVSLVASLAAQQAFVREIETGTPGRVDASALRDAASRVHRSATPEAEARLQAFAQAHGQGAAGLISMNREQGDQTVGPIETTSSQSAQLWQTRPHGLASGAVVRPSAALPFRFVQARDLAAELHMLPFISYALQHVGIHPVQRLSLENLSAEASQNLVVELALVPDDFAATWTANVSELPAMGNWQADNISLPLRLDRLRAVREREIAHIQLVVRDKDQVLFARTQEVPVLAYNEWIFNEELLDLTAAFVQPNVSELEPLVAAAAGRLQALCGSSSLSGYQRGSRQHVLQMLTALHDTLLHDWQLAYINPPPSFEQTGQKLRLVAQTLAQRRGTCLDLAVLQAAAWEHIGLHPLIVLVPGHALLGCWLQERKTLDQTEAVSRLGQPPAKGLMEAVRDGRLIWINSVEVATGENFRQAVTAGQSIIDQCLTSGQPVHVIDLAMARRRVRPLP